MMNKKKVTCSALAALMIAGTTSFPALAEMPKGTVVIGEKAFALDYANAEDNKKEMIDEIKAIQTTEGKVYVKAPNGIWFNNDKSKLEDTSVIPAVTYKDAEGTKDFEAGDGEEAGQGEFRIVEISAMGSKKIEVNFSKPVEKAGDLTLKIKRDGVSVSIKDGENVWSEDKKTLTLTTYSSLKDGEYTITAKNGEEEEVSFTKELEAAKLDTINIKGDSLVMMDEKTVAVTVEFLTQYEGETVSVSQNDFFVYGLGTGTEWTYSSTTGKITFKKSANSEAEFEIGKEYDVRVYHKESGVQTTKKLTVSEGIKMDSIELGEIVTDDKDLKDKPLYASTLKDNTPEHNKDAVYYIPVVAKDQYGEAISASDLNAEVENDTLIVYPEDSDIVKLGYEKNNKSVYFEEDDDDNVFIRVGAAEDNEAGTETIRIFSIASDVKGEIEVKVEENPNIGVLEIEEPEILKINTETDLIFTAQDQYGNPLVDDEELEVDEEKSDDDTVTFYDGSKVEINGGTIKYGVDYGDDNKRTLTVTPTDDNVVITVNLDSGDYKILKLTAKDEPIVQSITGIDFSTLVQTGVSQEFDIDCVEFIDQYDEDCTKIGDDYKVVIKDSDDHETVLSDDKKVTIDGLEEEDFTITLYNKDDEEVSSYDFTVEPVDVEDIKKFDIEFTDDRTRLYTGIAGQNDYSLEYKIVGEIDGDEVEVKQDSTIIKGITVGDSNVTTTGGAITFKGDIDDEYDNKKVKINLLTQNGDLITKEIILSDASPVAKEVIIYEDKDDKVEDPEILVPVNALNGKDLASEDNYFNFAIMDQYGVRLTNATFFFNTDEDGVTGSFNGSVLTTNAQPGDEIEITAIAKNGEFGKIKVVVDKASK